MNMNVMYLFVTSAIGMFEQKNTRVGTSEFSFSAQHIGSVNIWCNERANSFLYLSRYLVEHFFSLCSFQNIISRCVATIRIFSPSLFCFIVVSLLHNLPCFHVSFFILVDFFFVCFIFHSATTKSHLSCEFELYELCIIVMNFVSSS